MLPLGKILVIRGGAIGDFILTLPALEALRRQFPQSRIELLAYPHVAQLALLGNLAHAIRSIEARALAGFFARDGQLDRELAGYFSSFNIILSYLYDPDQIFQNNVARCSAAQFIPGPHRPNENENLHATQVFLKPLERLAIFDADPVPRLSLNLKSPAVTQLALHPGSGSEKKNWPEHGWVEFLHGLVQSSDFNLLLVGGEAEGDKLQRLAGKLPQDRIRLAQQLPLVELAEHLRSCSAFVGHDSGITHLAAALGLPGLVLWGETKEEIWRPRGEKIKIIRAANGLARLEVDQVAKELQAVLSCVV